VKKNRFEPSHALALHLGPGDVKCRAEICAERKEDPGDSDAASAFLRGESLLAQDCREIRSDQGWCLVTDCGFSMGWGKLSGGRIRNHYPKGLRRPY
jgi:NOL1/NOP2/fmu family ribosome biogenesis protein